MERMQDCGLKSGPAKAGRYDNDSCSPKSPPPRKQCYDDLAAAHQGVHKQSSDNTNSPAQSTKHPDTFPPPRNTFHLPSHSNYGKAKAFFNGTHLDTEAIEMANLDDVFKANDNVHIDPAPASQDIVKGPNVQAASNNVGADRHFIHQRTFAEYCSRTGSPEADTCPAPIKPRTGGRTIEQIQNDWRSPGDATARRGHLQANDTSDKIGHTVDPPMKKPQPIVCQDAQGKAPHGSVPKVEQDPFLSQEEMDAQRESSKSRSSFSESKQSISQTAHEADQSDKHVARRSEIRNSYYTMSSDNGEGIEQDSVPVPGTHVEDSNNDWDTVPSASNQTLGHARQSGSWATTTRPSGESSRSPSRMQFHPGDPKLAQTHIRSHKIGKHIPDYTFTGYPSDGPVGERNALPRRRPSEANLSVVPEAPSSPSTSVVSGTRRGTFVDRTSFIRDSERERMNEHEMFKQMSGQSMHPSVQSQPRRHPSGADPNRYSETGHMLESDVYDRRSSRHSTHPSVQSPRRAVQSQRRLQSLVANPNRSSETGHLLDSEIYEHYSGHKRTMTVGSMSTPTRAPRCGGAIAHLRTQSSSQHLTPDTYRFRSNHASLIAASDDHDFSSPRNRYQYQTQSGVDFVQSPEHRRWQDKQWQLELSRQWFFACLFCFFPLLILYGFGGLDCLVRWYTKNDVDCFHPKYKNAAKWIGVMTMTVIVTGVAAVLVAYALRPQLMPTSMA